MRNATFITAAGRTIRVPQPLDESLPLISPGKRLPFQDEPGPRPFRRRVHALAMLPPAGS